MPETGNANSLRLNVQLENPEFVHAKVLKNETFLLNDAILLRKEKFI